MKFIKEKGPRILAYLVEILIGVLLIAEPLKFTRIVIVSAGAIMFLFGAFDAFKYFKAEAAEAAEGKLLYRGMIIILAGGFCMVRSGWFVETFPILSIIYGLGILLAGLFKIQWTVDTLRLKKDNFIVPAISAAVTLICAIVILANPFTSEKVLWCFAGVSLIVEACVDMATLFIKGTEPVYKDNIMGELDDEIEG